MKNRRLDNVRYEFRHNRQAVFAAAFLILAALVSIGIGFVDADPDAIDVTNKLKPVSSEHIFGTDEMGRDYFLRVLYGGRVSLLVGVMAMLCSIVIGVAAGTASGYLGGFWDSLLMRFIDILSSIPWIIMVTLFSLLFRRGLVSIIVVIGLFSWMEIARLVRSEVLSAKEREYVHYARFVGQKPFSIMLKHIIPTVFPTIITAATATIASAIMMESALSFLSLGVAAPTSSWGSLLQSSQKYLQKAPHMAFIPGVLIILTVYSFNKLGDVLRIFVEPRVLEEKGK